VWGLGALPPLEAAASGEAAPPVLFVGNHQLYGYLDIPLLIEELHEQTGSLVRGLAHPVIFQGGGKGGGTGGFGGGSSNSSSSGGERSGNPLDFKEFGSVPVGPRALYRLLQQGTPTLLYPGGVREAFKSTKRGESYGLFWPSAEEAGADFARVAAKFGALIVPVAAVGAEEGFEMLLDADDLLKVPVLGKRIEEGAKNAPVGRTGERFVSPLSAPTVPGRYYFLFGEPIETADIDPSDKEACAKVYDDTKSELDGCIQYLLEKRKADPNEAALPRVALEAATGWALQAPTFRL
jgi:1-acyl-sn-glycerol-3-phosphate acyltransferase